MGPKADDGAVMLEGLRFEAKRDGETAVITATEPRDLLSKGNVALDRGAHRDALAHYDDLVRTFPDSGLLGAAQFNAGLALEFLGEDANALARYQRALTAADGAPRLAIDSLFRIGAIETALGRPRKALRAFETIDTLAPTDRDTLELGARRGAAQLALGDELAAEALIRKTLAAAALLPRDAEHRYYEAMAATVLGDVAAAPMKALDMSQTDAIERGAAIAERALDRYGAVIERRSVYWTTAAVYRAARLHSDFFKRIVRSPIPPNLTPAEEATYRTELLDQAKPLLMRAIDLHEKNLDFATKANTETEWSGASAAELPRLRAALGAP